MARQCRQCKFCKMGMRVRTARSLIGRRKYFCINPLLFDIPYAAFGKKERGLIGLGEASHESPLALKTHPRWCPMEVFK